MKKISFYYIFLLLLLILPAASGCRKAPEPETTTQETTTETTTEEPTTVPSPFGEIDGLEYYGFDPAHSPIANDERSLFAVALTDSRLETTAEGDYRFPPFVYSAGGGKLYVTWETMANYGGIEEYGENEENEEIEVPEETEAPEETEVPEETEEPVMDGDPSLPGYHVAVFDTGTGKITARLDRTSEEAGSYWTHSGDLLVFNETTYYDTEERTETITHLTYYDQDLKPLREFDVDGKNSPVWNPAGDYAYYVSEHQVFRLPAGENTEPEPVPLPEGMTPLYCFGVTTQGGVDYLNLTMVMSDLLNYYGILNTQDGTFRYLRDSSDSGFLRILPDYFCFHDDSGAEAAVQEVYYLSDRSVKVSCDEDSTEAADLVQTCVLANEDILQIHFPGTWGGEDTPSVFFRILDKQTGHVRCSAGLALPAVMPYLSGDTIELPDGRILVDVTDNVSHLFLCFDPSSAGIFPEDPLSFQRVEVSEGDLGYIAEIENIVNPEDLRPGPCREEYADLRVRADRLQECFGIQIRISDECRMYMGSYLVHPLNRRSAIAEALDLLESELSRYPDNFFHVLLDGENLPEAFYIYLTGDIKGSGTDGTLETAGGFEFTFENAYRLVIDVQSPLSLYTSLHHEIAHAMDERMVMDDDVDIFGQGWLALNPDQETYGDIYTYDYTQFGRSEMMDFTCAGEDPLKYYFVDGYSMVTPGEDHARLWENAMDNDNSYPEWANAPHLSAKLNYYADAVEKVFGSSIIPDEIRDRDWREHLPAGE